MRAFALQPELLHKMPIDSALSELTAQLKKIEAAMETCTTASLLG